MLEKSKNHEAKTTPVFNLVVKSSTSFQAILIETPENFLLFLRIKAILSFYCALIA